MRGQNPQISGQNQQLPDQSFPAFHGVQQCEVQQISGPNRRISGQNQLIPNQSFPDFSANNFAQQHHSLEVATTTMIEIPTSQYTASFPPTFSANHGADTCFTTSANNEAAGCKSKKSKKAVPNCFVPKRGNAKPRQTNKKDNKKVTLGRVTNLKNKSIKISSARKVY